MIENNYLRFNSCSTLACGHIVTSEGHPHIIKLITTISVSPICSYICLSYRKPFVLNAKLILKNHGNALDLASYGERERMVSGEVPLWLLLISLN